MHSSRQECLDRLILFKECSLLRALDEFVAHYHGERNHQGLGTELIMPESCTLWAIHVRLFNPETLRSGWGDRAVQET